MFKVPFDDNHKGIQALRFEGGSVVNITTSGSSQAQSIGSRQLFSIACDEDCYLEIGDNTVTATALSWPLYAKDRQVFFTDENQTHVAVIQKDTAGLFRIMKHGSINT